MMWAVAGLLVTVLAVESYIVRDEHERLSHGRQLKIYLPKSTEKLEFIPADNPRQKLVYWDKMHSGTRVQRGKVSGSGNDRRWYLDQVTFDDQGTYIQKDYWDKEMSTLKVAVTSKNSYIKRVPGRALHIQLEGLRQEDATLTFSGDSANVTLVRDGAVVSQDLFEYFDRVRLTQKSIEIISVNVSDVGRYHLNDRKGRLVSVTRLDLSDKDDEANGNPLLALLLLLGIPAGVCCCCRKKIFKKKATTAQTQQAFPGIIVSPSGPSGPSPPYNQPGGGYYPTQGTDLGPSVHPPPAAPGPGQWNGPPPSPGFNPAYPAPNPAYPAPNPAYPAANPVYPPANPVYPPANPVYPPANPGYPPAGAPQWNGPPPAAGPYPSAPMGYAPAPVMYSEAPPKEDIKMENMAPAPTDPLLAHPPQTSPSAASAPPVAPSTTDTLHSADGAATFDIGKNTNNFL
ncbi:uncharacterized protein [Eucyclogobius newberryi]|uniref:uncharacterized protein n=1 Tax=Eucyclogobius newberryi TaxID=166745 RepID=UPI003B598131